MNRVFLGREPWVCRELTQNPRRNEDLGALKVYPRSLHRRQGQFAVGQLEEKF